MIKDTLFRLKEKRRDVMVLEFLFFFAHLRLSHLSQIQQKKIMHNTSLRINKAIEILKYRKNNDKY